MKKFIAGILFTLLCVGLCVFFFRKKQEEATLQADSALIQTQIQNVSKLIVTEGHFAEVLSYTDNQRFFLDLFSVDKKILVVVNAYVTISYDLQHIDYQIDTENKKVIIKSIPEAELKIHPKLKYYDISQSQLNPFKAEDVEKIERKISAELEQKIAQSQLKKNAENRLISELSNILIVSKSMGWTLEYPSQPNLILKN